MRPDPQGGMPLNIRFTLVPKIITLASKFEGIIA